MSKDTPRRGFWDLLRARTDAPTVAEAPRSDKESDDVAPALRIAAAYTWRLLIMAAGIVVAAWVVIEFKLLVIPILVAILLTALVWPAHSLLRRIPHMPRWIAIAITVLGTIGIVVGLLWMVGWQIGREAHKVRNQAGDMIAQTHEWLIDTGLVTDTQISEFFANVLGFIREQADLLLSGALSVGTTVGQFGAGMLIALFVLVCLLADGEPIWKWTLKLFPRKARDAVDAAARNGWKTLINYARTQIIVATIDAVGIGLGAFLLGVPLAIPIAVLVFLGAFVPFVGAIVTGIIAVLIALVTDGLWLAVAMLAVVLLVQQVESHLLQPLLMGSAVKVHPLAVVLVVAGGSMIGGIAGALFAVPVAAFVNVVAVTISSGSWRTGVEPQNALIWSTVPKKIGPDNERREGKTA